MQITINTADILGDEATIRDEVINQVSSALIVSMRKQASDELAKMLEQNLKTVVTDVVSTAIAMAVDTEFTDVDEYGREGKTATIRGRIADHIQSLCTFKPARYSSDESPFTKAVKDVVEKEVAKFKAEFTSLVTRQVIEQSMDMAVNKLRESLGIKK